MKIKDTLPRCPKPAAAFPLFPSVVLRDHTKPCQPHTLDCRTLDQPIPHTLCTQHCPFWGVSSCPEKGNGATPGSSLRTPTCQGVWRQSRRSPAHPGHGMYRTPEPRGSSSRPAWPPRGLSQHRCTLWASWVTPSFASEQLELSRRHLRCKHNTQILSTSEAGAAALPGKGGSARWPRPRQDEAVPAGRGQQREPEFGRPEAAPAPVLRKAQRCTRQLIRA